MKALVTGASSGIGKDMAKYLDELGYEVILVARSEDKLKEVAASLKNPCKVLVADLSKEEECYALYEETKDEHIDLLVNNAGFGVFGNFVETSLEDEIDMIRVNDIAPHILTKLFLRDFVARDSGNILNVCSSAAFYSGPLMATYYATKGYIYKLSQAIYEELRKKKSNVHITSLCPGPIATNFQTVAEVKFNMKPLKSEYVAKKAIDGTLKNKRQIILGNSMKISRFFSRFIPDKVMLKIAYKAQSKKK